MVVPAGIHAESRWYVVGHRIQCNKSLFGWIECFKSWILDETQVWQTWRGQNIFGVAEELLQWLCGQRAKQSIWKLYSQFLTPHLLTTRSLPYLPQAKQHVDLVSSQFWQMPAFPIHALWNTPLHSPAHLRTIPDVKHVSQTRRFDTYSNSSSADEIWHFRMILSFRLRFFSSVSILILSLKSPWFGSVFIDRWLIFVVSSLIRTTFVTCLWFLAILQVSLWTCCNIFPNLRSFKINGRNSE